MGRWSRTSTTSGLGAARLDAGDEPRQELGAVDRPVRVEEDHLRDEPVDEARDLALEAPEPARCALPHADEPVQRAGRFVAGRDLARREPEVLAEQPIADPGDRAL